MVVTTRTCVKGFSISTVALVFSLELQNEIFIIQTVEALTIEGTVSENSYHLYCQECAAQIAMPTATNYFSSIIWCYCCIMQTFDFIAHSDIAGMTCSTRYGFSREL